MDFKELLEKRYSVRNYKNEKLKREFLDKIIEAGQFAPSACNKQPWHFLVVDDSDLLERIHTAYNRKWFQEAPAVIIAYGNHQEAWKRNHDDKDHCDIDVAIAVDHMTLMAAELGLGSCWICHFDPKALEVVIPTPKYWEPIAILTLGYSKDDKIPIKKRKRSEEIVSYNKW